MPPILFTPPLGVIFLSLKDPTHHLCSPRTVGAAHAHARTRTRFCPPRRRIHTSHSTSGSHPAQLAGLPGCHPLSPESHSFTETFVPVKIHGASFDLSLSGSYPFISSFLLCNHFMISRWFLDFFLIQLFLHLCIKYVCINVYIYFFSKSVYSF